MVTVFHRSRGSLIDVDTGTGQAWSFGSQPEARDLDWSAGPRRAQRGYAPQATFSLTQRDTMLEEKVGQQGDQLLFGDSRWLLLDGQRQYADTIKSEDITHVLVLNGFKAALMPTFTGVTPVIIIDGSTPFYHYSAWRKKAEIMGLSVHFTGEDGAFEYGW
jgi:hypothetical protein